jgi:hypothetical protein
MTSDPPTHSFLRYITRQGRLFVVGGFYLLTIVATVAAISFLVTLLPSSLWLLLIAGAMLICTAAIVFGSYISTSIELVEVFFKYDRIRNAIALGEIADATGFTRSFNQFVSDELGHILFSISCSALKVVERPVDASHPEIVDCFEPGYLDDLEAECIADGSIREAAGVSFEQCPYRSYVVPVVFGSRYLGYWLIVTEKRLRGLQLGFLSDVSRFMIDDQLMLVMRTERNRQGDLPGVATGGSESDTVKE